ncbi:acetyl-coenzyme A synthetase N-terminal domain-containing protein [Micromonospora carbonacea]|uniref:acetyl-coenzyme A synthetase N-terminal domain-containing protein n=1 Tax=Micromonospora carbonacea TaxID=47853 RepID=UPI003D9E85A7
MGAYRAAYERSIADPTGFWRDAAAEIDWHRPPQRILDDTRARCTAGSPTAS